MKSELELLESMTPDERRVFLQQQQVEMQELQLQSMVDDNRFQEEFIQWCIKTAENHQADGNITVAAEYIDIIKIMKTARHTIADIRKQRGVVQWEKTKLKELSSKPSESSES